MWGWIRRKRRVYYQTGNYPVKAFVVGNVEVAIWLNRDNRGKYHYMLSYNGLYGRDRDQRRRTVFPADLRDLRKAEDKAVAWIEQGGIGR